MAHGAPARRRPQVLVLVLVVTAVLVAGLAITFAGSGDRAPEIADAPRNVPEAGDVDDGAGDGVPDGDDGTDAPDDAPEEPDPTPDPEADEDEAPVDEVEATGGEGGDHGREQLVITHVGDVSLDVSDVPVLGRGDLDGPWEGVRDTFLAADLAIVNLECAATDGGSPASKQFVFRCSLDALPAMRDAGVDIATLANNHTGDYGVQGMVDSVDNVEAAGIATVGVGRNETEAYTPHVVEVAGWRVAVLGFGGVVPVPEWTAHGDRPGQATGYDAARMAQAVAEIAPDVDVTVVTVHWGNEGVYEPRPEDVVKAEAMIAAGADVVFGHHSHRLQPLDIVDDVPVFWSLGNFVWPRNSPEAAVTAVAEYILDPDGTVTSCLIPYEIDADGVPHPTGADRRCAAPTNLR